MCLKLLRAVRSDLACLTSSLHIALVLLGLAFGYGMCRAVQQVRPRRGRLPVMVSSSVVSRQCADVPYVLQAV
jgi:hypothetical protein